jgi:hypothetical protein
MLHASRGLVPPSLRTLAPLFLFALIVPHFRRERDAQSGGTPVLRTR